MDLRCKIQAPHDWRSVRTEYGIVHTSRGLHSQLHKGPSGCCWVESYDPSTNNGMGCKNSGLLVVRLHNYTVYKHYILVAICKTHAAYLSDLRKGLVEILGTIDRETILELRRVNG